MANARTLHAGSVPALRALILICIAAALAVGCTAAKQNDPALPAGFAERGIPDVELNAYLYVDAGAPVAAPASAFGEGSNDDVSVAWMETVLLNVGVDRATRIELADASEGALVGALASVSPGAAWVDVAGHSVAMGASEGAWADTLRAAWAEEARATVDSRYPDVWNVLRLLPPDPPSQPIAVGFTRDVREAAGDALAWGIIDVPGLESALNLLRVEVVAFALYSPEPVVMPERLTAEAILTANLRVVAIADAEYPGVLVDLLIGRFAGKLGLADTTVEDEDAMSRTLPGGLHLFFKNYGAALYFVVAGTQADAEGLLGSIIIAQR